MERIDYVWFVSNWLVIGVMLLVLHIVVVGHPIETPDWNVGGREFNLLLFWLGMWIAPIAKSVSNALASLKKHKPKTEE